MRYAAWVKTGEKSRRQQKAYAPARSINIARPVLAFVIAGLTVSMTVSAAELSISKDYPVGPNVDDSGQKNIKVSAEKTTLLDVGVHGKSPWSIVEKTASVDGTFDNCTPTSVTYTYNPKDPEEAFNVTFTGELTRSSEGGSGERPGYELTASANDDNLFVVPAPRKS